MTVAPSPPPCATLLGWRLLEADPATGMVRAAMTAIAAFCNPSGNVQGGFVAAMLDETMGPTVRVASGGARYGTTIDLNVSFLAAVKPGALVGVGRVVRMGGTIAFLEGELSDSHGRIVAKATATARVFATPGAQRR